MRLRLERPKNIGNMQLIETDYHLSKLIKEAIIPRDLKSHENQKRSKARRMHALARMDLREPSTPRAAAVGATSHAVKKIDIATEQAISAFLAKRIAGTPT